MHEIYRAVLEGMLGAVLFLAFKFWSKDFKYENKVRERIACRILMGAIVGYLWLMQSMPNSFNTVMAGMLAPELIEGFAERFKEEYIENILSKG